MQTFIDPDLLDRLRVGPLGSYLDAYLKRIEQEGFLPSSVPMQMYGIARFSNWLQTRQPDLYLLDEATIKRFLQRDQNIVHSAESAPLRRFLAMLRAKVPIDPVAIKADPYLARGVSQPPAAPAGMLCGVRFEADKVQVYLDGTQMRLEPGQTVIAHGVDRNLSTDEVGRGRHP